MVPENWKARVEMLRHLARLEANDKGSPSVRELGEAVGFRSSQTAYKHLKRLEEAGYVERRVGRARGVRLTEKGWEAAVKSDLRNGHARSDQLPVASSLSRRRRKWFTNWCRTFFSRCFSAAAKRRSATPIRVD